jgi:hypothetical protein
VAVEGKRIGDVHQSNGPGGHAEQLLADSGDFDTALAVAAQAGTTLDLVINRTPCSTSCQAVVEYMARQAKAGGRSLAEALDNINPSGP